MRYDLFVFDFDYTLADATPGIVLSVNYGLERMDLPPADTQAIRRTVGMSLPETYAALTGDIDAGAGARFADFFREMADGVMTDHTVLYPDTERVLGAMRRGGGRVAIVTSKFRYRIEQALDKYGIAHLVDLVIGFEDVSEHKPSPEGLLRVLAQIPHAAALYAGDSLIDAETAHRAGVDFAAVLTGATGRDAFAAHPSVAIARSLSELYAALGGGGAGA